MKIKSFVAAAAIALSSFGAFAVPNSTPITFENGSAYFNNNPFPASPAGFTQTFAFSGLAAGLYDVVGSVIGTNLSFLSVTLDGSAWSITNYTFAKTRVGLGILEVTANTPTMLTLVGNTFAGTPSSSYSGSLSVSPVPEPETFAMLLAGLGLIGSIARRRTKAAA